MESIIFTIDGREDLLKGILIAYAGSGGVGPHAPYPKAGKVNTQSFSDGEVCVDFKTSVRNKRVYLLSSPDTSDKIMALNMAIDAAKRAAAKEIIPILPYFPYARQDKKDQPRGPIGAKVLAEMLENRGATGIVTFDLHADQIQGFFNIPVTHMEGKYLFGSVIKELNSRFTPAGTSTHYSTILCSPDAGGVKRVKQFRDWMGEKYDLPMDYVTIDKTRAEANVISTMKVIGDVQGKHVIIVDDMCDTAGTLCKAADHLIEEGATGVTAIITHGIFSGPAYERIRNSQLSSVFCSDSLNIEGLNNEEPINVISTEKEIAKAIIAINKGQSIEALKVT